MVFSCANQLPPSGGEQDTYPPKIISVFPKPNTVLFKGNSVRIKFDEYVDRRSLQESFFIYPDPGGSAEFSWSGKEAEISFPEGLRKNVTYLITLGKELKDIREGNILGRPYRFAFSTGSKIDKGIIEGKIISDKFDRVKVFGYKLTGKDVNPEKDAPEYIVGSNDSGYFSLLNLAEGKYRIFAVYDDDRNNLYGKDFETVAMLNDDIVISSSKEKTGGAYFMLINPEIKKSDPKFLNLLKSDSSGNIFSYTGREGKYILPDQRFYFLFKSNIADKSDIINNISLTDSVSDKSYNLVFNWINDSLLEIFSTEKFKYSSLLTMRITPEENKNLFFSERLSVIDKSKTGTVEGKIVLSEKTDYPVYIKLINRDDIFVMFSKKIEGTDAFEFTDIPEGNYMLFAFIDSNENGTYDKGNHFPYSSSERLSVYEKDLSIKGGWKTDNVFVEF